MRWTRATPSDTAAGADWDALAEPAAAPAAVPPASVHAFAIFSAPAADQGEVVVVNDKFGIRLTDISNPAQRVRRLKR